MSLHINQLPHGTIQDILEYLPVNSRASASLVCRLWNQEAFSIRLQSSVRLCIDCRQKDNWDKVLNAVQSSCRSYHNLHVVFNNKEECPDRQSTVVTAVLSLIGLKIEKLLISESCLCFQLRNILIQTPNLKTLEAAVVSHPTAAEQQIKLPVLAKLHDLSLLMAVNHTLETEQFDVLHIAPNVQRIEMMIDDFGSEQSFEILKGYAAQLRMISIGAYSDSHPIPIDELQFKQLQVMILDGRPYENDNTSLRRLFLNVPQLRVLYLSKLSMPRSLLEIICTNCTLLRTLNMWMHNSEEQSFQCLAKLTSLQVLNIFCLSLDVMKNCKPLMNVNQIGFKPDLESIDLTEAFVDELHKVLPNLQTIDLCFRTNQPSIVKEFLVNQICQKFVHLKNFTLSGFLSADEGKTLQLSNGLGNVEVLWISGRRVCYDLPPLNNVTHLHLMKVYPFNLKFAEIEKIFPNLRYLKVRNCRRLDQRMIADVRRRIPDCVVNYEPARFPAKTYNTIIKFY